MKRVGLCVFLIAVALAGGGVAPASAVTGTVTQERPAVVSPAEPVPGSSRNVTLVSHLAPGIHVGDSTPAGQYGALAIAGNCAYIGRRSFNSTDNADNGVGVQVVDISNPAAPVYRGQVAGTTFVDSTARELRAIAQYKLLIVLHYSRFTAGGVQAANGAVDTGGRNVFQAFHINPDCSATHLADYDMGPIRPHEFYVWLDPKVPGRVIAYITTPFGPVEMEVVDFSSCSTVRNAAPTSCSPSLLTAWDGVFPQPNPAAVDNSGIGNYLHSLSVSPDGKTGYMAFWNGGFFTVNTSLVAAGAAHPAVIGEASTSLRDDWSQHNGPTGQGGDAHSAVWIPTDLRRTNVKPYVVLTDEDYLGVGDCPFGWLRLDRVDQLAGGLTRPVPVGSFGLPENLLTQEAAEATFASKPNAVVTDPTTCAGYNRDHPGFLAANSSWPGGQVPANIYSAHNPTTLPDLVLLTWYGGGFRVVNIHDPANPAETGYFVPRPEPKVNEEFDDPTGQLAACYYPVSPPDAQGNNCLVYQTAAQAAAGTPTHYKVLPQVESWSYPVVKDGLIYFVDNRNGLYVVKYSGAYAAEVEATAFAEGNSNNGQRGLPGGPGASRTTAAVAAATMPGSPVAARTAPSTQTPALPRPASAPSLASSLWRGAAGLGIGVIIAFAALALVLRLVLRRRPG